MLIYLLFCFCKVMINDLNLFVFSSRFKNQKESAEVNIVNWFSFLPSFGFPDNTPSWFSSLFFPHAPVYSFSVSFVSFLSSPFLYAMDKTRK